MPATKQRASSWSLCKKGTVRQKTRKTKGGLAQGRPGPGRVNAEIELFGWQATSPTVWDWTEDSSLKPGSVKGLLQSSLPRAAAAPSKHIPSGQDEGDSAHPGRPVWEPDWVGENGFVMACAARWRHLACLAMKLTRACGVFFYLQVQVLGRCVPHTAAPLGPNSRFVDLHDA